MARASLEDVKRILRLRDDDPARDAEIRASLAAVESWADKRLWDTSRSGLQCETYFDISEDATLQLPSEDCTVVKVKVFEYPSSYGIPLSPVELGLGHGYDMTDNGRLMLRPTLFVSPFDGASAQRRLRQYERVEVHYLGTGVVPRAVTEGVAFLAAGHWQDGPRALQGLTSEKIGDYSYTLGGSGTPGGEEDAAFVQRAMWFLKTYLKKQRVAVT